MCVIVPPTLQRPYIICLGDCAYVFIEMVFDSEKFGGGIPPLSFIVKGKKVYDPRLDSTVGGSGSQRFNDPTTHTISCKYINL